jgi:hypothetical protein
VTKENCSSHFPEKIKVERHLITLVNIQMQ